MPDLTTYGPWALIAGGSEGVGAEFATQLADAGFNLVLLARKPGPLEETAAACRERGVEARAVAVDLLAPDAMATIAAATDDIEVGLLIFNAGANTYGHAFTAGDLAGHQGVIDLNVTVPLALVHHFAPAMKERGRGGILLTGSLAGYVGSSSEAIYGAAKAFNRIFAEGLWVELKEYGVDVLHLVLGVTRTPAMERAGLNFDLPGMVVSEPADVAHEGLENLANGPVHIVPGNEKMVEVRGRLDRAKLVSKTDAVLKMLMSH
ncbi:MAG: SDR family NAD(P)-dependent oxidoreductase [Nocardioides sp.]|uniref:SDR family NAD(P)-dependent oxidoreductase n=1 Tax=Nocardioides sp. TaxID=35761 RepID=UPI003EFC300C